MDPTTYGEILVEFEDIIKRACIVTGKLETIHQDAAHDDLLTPVLTLALWQEQGVAPVPSTGILDANAGALEWRAPDGRIYERVAVDFKVGTALFCFFATDH